MRQRQPGPVRFAFERCDSRMIARSVIAAVDHLCSLEDIDVQLLEGLEVPVGECLDALDADRIDAVDVEVVDARLVLEVSTGRSVADVGPHLFGDARTLVQSFFETIDTTPTGRLRLVGELR